MRAQEGWTSGFFPSFVAKAAQWVSFLPVHRSVIRGGMIAEGVFVKLKHVQGQEMKRNGILNAKLSSIVAGMGHTDRLVVCDSGLPIPRDAEVVDLALTFNVPRFLDTVAAVLQELEVESAIIAEEMETANSATYRELVRLLAAIPTTKVPHEEFKNMLSSAGKIAFVRTGEATPFANVILIGGVTFT